MDEHQIENLLDEFEDEIWGGNSKDDLDLDENKNDENKCSVVQIILTLNNLVRMTVTQNYKIRVLIFLIMNPAFDSTK